MAPNVFTRHSTTVVKGPSKHVGVSRIGASLIPGEFVKFNGCKCRGRIIDVAHGFDNIPMAERPSEREDRSFLLVQKHEILDEMSAEVQSRSTGLNAIEYRYVTDDVKEVDVTDSLEWVHSDGIDGIAFVFHVDSINDQIYPCNGKANAYFVRQRIDSNGGFVPIVDHNPPHLSYSRRIWGGIVACRTECNKALNGRKMWPKKQKNNSHEECG
jgi:hypothetical protein